MRWDNLFDDLESQLEQELDAEDIDLRAEEERLRLGRLAMRDRLRALMSSATTPDPVRLVLADGTRATLALGAVGRDWIAGELRGDRQNGGSCIIPIAAISSCLPTPEQTFASMEVGADPGAGALAGRLGLPFVLRDLCRRRASVHVRTKRELVHGTIDRVGRDHIDLAEHDAGVARRAPAVRAIRMLPFTELVVVQF